MSGDALCPLLGNLNSCTRLQLQKNVRGNGVGMGSFWHSVFVPMGVALSLVSCGKKLSENQLPVPSARLVSQSSAFPGIVMLSGSQLCTGAIVGPSTVLTAAHCINQPRGLTLQTSSGTRTVSQFIKLGAGVEGDPNDLALLYLNAPVSADQILSLASGVSRGDQVTLVGYGCNHSESPGPSGVKRQGFNVVFDITDFIEVSTPGLNIKTIAGPENRAAVCFGDSGGPLLKLVNENWVVVGVAHGAYNDEGNQVSQFVDLHQPTNRAFLMQYIR